MYTAVCTIKGHDDKGPIKDIVIPASRSCSGDSSDCLLMAVLALCV